MNQLQSRQENSINFVYLVNHEYSLNEDEVEVKRIGIYTSKAEAEAAIARLRLQPGFRDLPESFVIHRYEIGKDYLTDGYDPSIEDQTDR
ncbi:hypothetical protein ACFYV7_12900 [Nocardia suismassiliense]|uniref:DUF7336 domain-containing protein n=1 Tax=Nocardia suismassiliense TaxID=2077092 RepID=A0ABW6QSU3_9NOCA